MPSRRRVLAAGTAAAAGLAGCEGGDRGDDDFPEAVSDTTGWPAFGHDSANTGYVPASPVTDPGEAWQTDIGLPPLGPTLADGTLYVPGRGLDAVDATSGETAWTSDAADTWFPPTVARGLVLAPATDGGLVGLDPASGDRRYTAPLPDGASANAAPTISHDDRVLFVGGSDDRLYAVDANSGDVEWARDVFGTVRAPVGANGGYVVAVTEPGIVYGFVDTGRATWRANLRMPMRTAPVVGDDRVYVGGHSGVVALDKETGREVWSRETAGFVRDGMALDGPRLFVAAGRTLLALDVATGAVRWSYETKAPLRCVPLVAGDTVYLGTGTGRLVALPTDGGGWSGGVLGRERWSVTLGDFVGYWLAATDLRVYAPVYREDDGHCLVTVE